LLSCFFFPGALVGVAADGEAGVEQSVRFRIPVSPGGFMKDGTSWSHPRRRIQSVQTSCMRSHRNLRRIACTTRSLHSASLKRARRAPCSLWRSASRRCRRLPPALALLCASSCCCSPFFRVGRLWRGSGAPCSGALPLPAWSGCFAAAGRGSQIVAPLYETPLPPSSFASFISWRSPRSSRLLNRSRAVEPD
jgi:hypothetical protein